MRMKNVSSVLGSQALRGSHEAHRGSASTDASGVVGGGENSVAAIGLLVDRDIVRKTPEEVQLALNPAKDLLGGHKHLEVSEAD